MKELRGAFPQLSSTAFPGRDTNLSINHESFPNVKTHHYWRVILFYCDQIEGFHVKYPYNWNDCDNVKETAWPKAVMRKVNVRLFLYYILQIRLFSDRVGARICPMGGLGSLTGGLHIRKHLSQQ